MPETHVIYLAVSEKLLVKFNLELQNTIGSVFLHLMEKYTNTCK